MNEQKCTDCGSPMEEGYIPDYGHGGVLQLSWQPGQPKPAWFRPCIKTPNEWSSRKVVAYCCTNCGLLKLFAIHERMS
jgi:Domain of unknown function (DUF6487)